MSTDVNKLAEEYADEVRWVPPSMSVDELKNEMVKAHQAGFRAALECEEVAGMRGAIAYVLQYDQNSPERGRLGAALSAFDRLLEGMTK